MHLRDKYGLKDIGKEKEVYDDLGFYIKRRLIIGINGDVYSHKTTGPCLLPTVDINSLNNRKIDLDKVFEKQPTLQNVLLNAVAAKGPIHICLETKEFSNLLNEITNNQKDYLDEFIKIANKTWQMVKNLMDWWEIKDSEINLHYSHEQKIDEYINLTCQKYSKYYISYLSSHHPTSNNYRLGKYFQKLLEKGNKPEDIYRLRVVSTYFPGWWGDDSIKEHTIVENVYHDAWMFTRQYSKTSMAALLPPKDLSFKKSEMDTGDPLYLGTEEKVREGFETLKATRFPNKNRYNCIVGNLLLFAVKKIEDFHCIESCGRKGITCKHDCSNCLDILEEFLIKISKT